MTGPAGNPVAGERLTARGMKSITLKQPWSWAVMFAGKTVENRRWSSSWRGPVAIHAGLGFDRAALTSIPMREAWASAVSGMGESRKDLTPDHPLLTRGRGAIIGVVTLKDVHLCDSIWGCHRESETGELTSLDGPLFCSPWGEVPVPPRGNERKLRHFVFGDPQPLPYPLLFTGHQNMRELPWSTEEIVRDRLRSGCY